MAESTSQLDPIVAGANAATRVNEAFDASSPAALYGRRAASSSGLLWGYFGGRFASTLIANGQVSLTESATNYVVADATTGAVSVSTSSTNWDDATNYVRLYRVVTGTVNVSSWEDHRQSIQPASSGGGGLINITEGVQTTAPNTPTTVVSLTASQAATDVDFALAPKGTGALLTRVPDSAATGGNKRGAYAIDMQLRRNAAAQVASGAEAGLFAGYNNTASGGQSVVLGGRDNSVSSILSAIIGGFSSSVSATAGVVVGGGSQTVAATYGGIFAGSGNQINAGGDYSVVVGGTGNISTGDRAFIAAGQNNRVSGEFSWVLGGEYATTRGIRAMGAHASGSFASTPGDAQSGYYVQYRTTSDATATQLSASNAAPSAANSIVLPNTSCYTFTAFISVRENATGDAAGFKVEGVIKRGASAATTALVGTPTVTSLGADAGAAAWAVAAVADTTQGALGFSVTGEAAHNLRWVARVQTTEVVG